MMLQGVVRKGNACCQEKHEVKYDKLLRCTFTAMVRPYRVQFAQPILSIVVSISRAQIFWPIALRKERNNTPSNNMPPFRGLK